MDESKVFELIGRKQVELDNSRAAFEILGVEYNNLLLTLSRVASGEITFDRVSVNLEARSWAVTPAAPLPETTQTPEPQ
jgi:hypothetical protein